MPWNCSAAPSRPARSRSPTCLPERCVKAPVVTVEVPVQRNGKPPLCLIVGMEPRIFLPLFEQWNLPEGWLAGLIDRNGNFIARSRDHETTVGRPASEDFATPRGDPGRAGTKWSRSKAATIANGHVTSPLSGWVIGLAADKELFEAPIRNTHPDRRPRRRRGDAAQPAARDLGGATHRRADRAGRTGNPCAGASQADDASPTPACRRSTARSMP